MQGHTQESEAKKQTTHKPICGFAAPDYHPRWKDPCRELKRLYFHKVHARGIDPFFTSHKPLGCEKGYGNEKTGQTKNKWQGYLRNVDVTWTSSHTLHASFNAMYDVNLPPIRM